MPISDYTEAWIPDAVTLALIEQLVAMLQERHRE